MMKRTYIITLLLSLCSLLAHAQESFFDKFADMEGVNSVYISKAMLSMMPDMVEAEGINVRKAVGKLDNIWVLSSERPSVIAQIKKEISIVSPITKKGYEELMLVNDEGDKVTIYLKQKKDGQKEFVLLSDEKTELTIIVITGKLTLQEIQEIVGQ